MHLITQLTYSGSLLLFTAVMAALPELSRKNICFGVAVPPEAVARAELARLRRRFRLAMAFLGGAVTLLQLGLALLWGSRETAETLFGVGVILLLSGEALAYWLCRRKVLALKRAENWTSLRDGRILVEFSPPRRIVPRWAFLFYLLIPAVTLWFTWRLYPSLPPRIPNSFDFTGITGYRPRSVGLVLLLPGVQLLFALLFRGLVHVLENSRRELDPQDPEHSAERQRAWRRGWGLYAYWMGLGLELLYMGLQMAVYQIISPSAFTAGSLAFGAGALAATLFLAVRLGQGGARLKLAGARDRAVSSLRDDDRYWKLGCFYWNPQDPAFLVEKRFGIGWTCNYANPKTWALTALLGLLLAGSLWEAVPAVGACIAALSGLGGLAGGYLLWKSRREG